MADTQITGLTARTAAAADEIPINRPGSPDVDGKVTAEGIASLFNRGLLWGLTLSNNTTDATNDIDIAAGVAAADTSPYPLMETAGLTKRLDAAWAVGSGNGGRDTGTIANALYYVWLIMRSDTGVVDVLFSLSATSPTMPANYDFKRRIGAFYRASNVIRPFEQRGDRFILQTPVADVAVTNLGTSRVLYTVTVPPNMMGMFRAYFFQASSNGAVILQPSYETNAAPGYAVSPGISLYQETANRGDAGHFEIGVNASSQIAARADLTSVNLTINTLGWIDTRGRLD